MRGRREIDSFARLVLALGLRKGEHALRPQIVAGAQRAESFAVGAILVTTMHMNAGRAFPPADAGRAFLNRSSGNFGPDSTLLSKIKYIVANATASLAGGRHGTLELG